MFVKTLKSNFWYVFPIYVIMKIEICGTKNEMLLPPYHQLRNHGEASHQFHQQWVHRD